MSVRSLQVVDNRKFVLGSVVGFGLCFIGRVACFALVRSFVRSSKNSLLRTQLPTGIVSREEASIYDKQHCLVNGAESVLKGVDF